MKNQFNLTYLLVFIFLFSGCKKEFRHRDESKPSSVKSVIGQKLKLIKDQLQIKGSGVLASESEISLSFKTGGVIRKIYFTEGAVVSKGQVLAELDLREINSQVKQAQIANDKALRDLERINQLYSDFAATLEQLQNASSAAEVAKANLQIAEFNLKHSKIIAPSAGKILNRSIEENEIVSPGQPSFLLGSSGKAGTQVVKTSLADIDILNVSLFDSAAVTFDILPHNEYAAKVTQISQAANKYTGTFSVELTLNKYHPELKNGFIANITIYPTTANHVYNIPMEALLEGNGQNAKVYISEDGHTVRSQILKITSIQNHQFQVSADQLSESHWLVLEGASYLNENDSISFTNL